MPDTLSLDVNYLGVYPGRFEIDADHQDFRNVTIIAHEEGMSGPGSVWLPFTPDDLKKLRDFLIEQYPIEDPKPQPRYRMYDQSSGYTRVVEIVTETSEVLREAANFAKREDAEAYVVSKNGALA